MTSCTYSSGMDWPHLNQHKENRPRWKRKKPNKTRAKEEKKLGVQTSFILFTHLLVGFYTALNNHIRLRFIETGRFACIHSQTPESMWYLLVLVMITLHWKCETDVQRAYMCITQYTYTKHILVTPQHFFFGRQTAFRWFIFFCVISCCAHFATMKIRRKKQKPKEICFQTWKWNQPIEQRSKKYKYMRERGREFYFSINENQATETWSIRL